MSKPIWSPDPNILPHTQMWQFLESVNTTYSQNFTEYSELYQWSIDHPEQFWPAIWEFCGVRFGKSWDIVLQDAKKMPGAKWFSGARLNFAENLLRYQDEKPALISVNEAGRRAVIHYSELYTAVTQLASSMRAMGVQAGDRVAAYMPNIAETIIAMLATTSIGAIWSSCSQDFGTQGVLDRFGQITPKVLFTTDGYFYNGKTHPALEKIATLEKAIPSLEKIIVVPYISEDPDISKIASATLYSDFLDKTAEKLPFAQLPFDQPVYILYSSGTTGVPKCIVHGAGGVLLQHLKELMLHTDLKREDTFFYFTTCGWMMWNWLVSGLTTGATLVLYDGSPFFPHYKSLFDLIDQENISIFGTSAKFISAAEKYHLEPIKTHKLSKLRTILSTGSPLLHMHYEYVYQKIKTSVQLSSISGGTDIVSCFALGNPILPVYEGELQCRGLGLKVEIFDESGKTVKAQKGELVCTAPFPAMPIAFWNDSDNKKYHAAYFEKFPNVWAHGDYAELTAHDGLIIYGRSDAILNPGGVRIGTAEIYRQVEKIPEILESLVIGQEWHDDVRIVLFVRLAEGVELDEALQTTLKNHIRQNASPHHVPAKIVQVKDIPRTLSGKIVELAVREVVHGRPVKNLEALANPEALEFFKGLEELQK